METVLLVQYLKQHLLPVMGEGLRICP